MKKDFQSAFTMKTFSFSGIGVVFFIILLCALSANVQAQKAKPNIVFILADDLGIGDVKVYNQHSKIATPYIDKMAAEGMRFTDAHSASAVCTPSRYAIVTGRYSWRSKLQQGVLYGYDPPLLRHDLLTVPALLKQAGYSTGIIGKWHLGMNWKMQGKVADFTKPLSETPTSFGFDYFYGISASLDMPPYVFIENDHLTELPVDSAKQAPGLRAGPKGPNFTFTNVSTTMLEKTEAFFRLNKNNPFFLYLPLPGPHTPLVPNKQFEGKSGICKYADYVMETDWVLGRVRQLLKEQGLFENTIVFFTSDNGYAPYAEYEQLKAAGHEPSGIYRGAKADIYEGGHRIPFVVSWPGNIKPNTINNNTVCQIDLMATCAAITGQQLPQNAGVDSYDMLPTLLQKGKYKREYLVNHSIDGSFALRKGDWKLAFCPGSGGWGAPKNKQALQQGLPEIQLYNLKNDIAEKNNVVAQYPHIVKQMTAKMFEIVNNGRSTKGAIQKNDAKIDVYKKAAWKK